MQPFYYHFRQQLVDRALEPDERIGKDPREASRHHIDLERLTLPVFLSMPMNWEAAAGKYSADSLYKFGIGPWATRTSIISNRDPKNKCSSSCSGACDGTARCAGARGSCRQACRLARAR